MNTQETNLVAALQGMNAATQEMQVWANILAGTPQDPSAVDYYNNHYVNLNPTDQDESIYAVFSARYDTVLVEHHGLYEDAAEVLGIASEVEEKCKRKKRPTH